MKHLIMYLISLVIRILSRNKLLILNYHRVLNTEHLYFSSDIDTQVFSWQIELINKYLYPMHLNEAIDLMYQDKLPKAAVSITFDDGYKDNIENALPVLLNKSVPATFYIASGFLNGGIMWNDIIIESIRHSKKKQIDLSLLNLGVLCIGSKEEKIAACEKIISRVKYSTVQKRESLVADINRICDVNLPKNLMLDDEDIVQLHQVGMEIGGHTANHPILACENDSVAENEMLVGKSHLEKLINIKLTSFAYPNGKLEQDYEPKHGDIAKKVGFKNAVTTNWGINSINNDCMQLFRFTPWDKTPMLFLLRLAKLYIFNKI